MKITLKELRSKLKTETVQSLFKPDYGGSCPCSMGSLTIDGHRVKIHTRCWRVSDNIGSGYQDLRIKTKHPEKEKIADLLKRELDSQKWYNPYKVIYD